MTSEMLTTLCGKIRVLCCKGFMQYLCEFSFRELKDLSWFEILHILLSANKEQVVLSRQRQYIGTLTFIAGLAFNLALDIEFLVFHPFNFILVVTHIYVFVLKPERFWLK